MKQLNEYEFLSNQGNRLIAKVEDGKVTITSTVVYKTLNVKCVTWENVIACEGAMIVAKNEDDALVVKAMVMANAKNKELWVDETDSREFNNSKEFGMSWDVGALQLAYKYTK